MKAPEAQGAPELTGMQPVLAVVDLSADPDGNVLGFGEATATGDSPV